MNIFVIEPDPVAAARSQCDCHVAKMGLEACQMLSTAHWATGGSAPYAPCWLNHPCTVWVRESRENYRWLVEHATALFDEYTLRYRRVHNSAAVLAVLRAKEPTLAQGPLTPFALAMPDLYKVPDDAVASYRNYYQTKRGGRLGTWSRNKPSWWRDL